MKNLILLLLTTFSLYQVFADFDCESIESSNSKCPSELTCIYDEAYESRSITSCRCKVSINALSLPGNALNYDLFRKVCSQHEDRLQELQINDAELESIDNKIFSKYRNLRFLNVTGNVLRLNFSEEAQRILDLDLSSNRLTSLILSNLNKLKLLKILNVSSNSLEKVDGIFSNFYELEEVYLNNNQLTVVDNDDFLNLPKLRIMNLAHNSLVSFSSDLNLPNLEELYLNNNKLVSLKRNGFQNLPNLKILNMAHNFIIDLDSGSSVVARRPITDSNKDIGNQQDTFSQFSKTQQNFANTITEKRNWFGSALPGGNQNNFGNYFTLPSIQNNAPKSNDNLGWWLGAPRNRRQAPETTTKSQNAGFFLVFGAPPFNQATTPKPSLKVDVAEEKALIFSSTWLKLQVLNLAGNRIKEFRQGFLENLPELQSLNVSFNALARFDFNQLNSSSKLTNLDVRGNRLIGLDLNLLRHRFSFLKILDFDLSLVKCDDVRDVLSYLKQRGIDLKGCNTAGGCC